MANPNPTSNAVFEEESKQYEQVMIDEGLLKRMEELSDQLIKQRKSTKPPIDYPSKDKMT